MEKKDLERNLAPGETKTIPALREELQVGKRKVETVVARIHKKAREREEVVDEPLLREEPHIERIPVNRFLERPVSVRQEGDVTIIPILEEVLVVEKRLRLKEEIRVTRRTTVERRPQKVALRSEEIIIEPADPEGRK